MNSLKEFKELVHDYSLDENETQIDSNSMPWFTAKFLADLFEVTPKTIENNAKKLSDLGEIDFKTNRKKLRLVHSDKPVFHYDINVLYSLGMWLRSPKALEFRNNIIKLLEGLRVGDLKLIDMKNFLNNIALKPTTPYRQKRNAYLVNNGLLDVHVKTRCFNAKLTSELSEMIRKLGYGNYLRAINRKFADAIYPNGINEFDLVNGVTNPHNRRDYCDYDQLTVTQYMSAKLVEKLVNHHGEITLNVLMDHVDDCVMIGLSLSDIMLK